MSKFKNLSDGTSDGFAVFYLKDGKLNTVALTQEQADMLDLCIQIPFQESGVRITPADPKVVKQYL